MDCCPAYFISENSADPNYFLFSSPRLSREPFIKFLDWFFFSRT